MKDKLIIHETDGYGAGFFVYKGVVKHYAYDDNVGNMRAVIEALIDIGFVDSKDVVIYDETNSIYNDISKCWESKGE